MTSKLNEMKYAAVMGAFINTTVYNNTVNNSTYDIPEKHQSVLSMYQTEQLILLWFLFAFVVIGNAIVLVSVCLVRHKKSRMNFFIMNLAIADLSVGLLNILPDIIHRYTREFYGGEIVCKLVKYVQAIVVYGSTYQLVALSIDRYDAIVHPMNFSGSDKRSMIMVISMWVVAFILAVPSPVFFEETVLENGEVQCWIELPQTWVWKPYSVILAFLLFFIPLVIVTFCYSVIIYTIWRKSKMMVPAKRRIFNEKNGNYKRSSKIKSNSISAKRSASSRGLIPKAKIKTIKMTLCIVLSFIVCWSPFTLWFILEIYGHIPKNDLTMTIHIIVQNLPSLNSATNPAIYGLFSTNICKELSRRTVRCRQWRSDCCQSNTSCAGRRRSCPRGSRRKTNNSQYNKTRRRIPALNWIAAKLPCCEEWSPRPRSTTYRDTNYTDVSMTEPPIPMKVKDDTNSKELIEGVYTSL